MVCLLIVCIVCSCGPDHGEIGAPRSCFTIPVTFDPLRVISMNTPMLNQDHMSAEFIARFQREPQVWSRAPGRVDLMGSHTDYNEGDVLTLTIDRETWIAAAPREDGAVRISSLNVDGEHLFDANDTTAPLAEGWALYVQGVALILKDAGYPIIGCDALVCGTVPIGSGLSSSASLEAATAVLFEQLGDFTLDRLEMAKLCQRAENDVVGVQCGILDQYSSILGEKSKALLLNCRETTHRYADFPAGIQNIICNTRAPRQLSGSEYGERRSACEEAAAVFSRIDPSIRTLRDVSPAMLESHESELPRTVAERARFVVEEHLRVHTLAEALSANDHDAIGEITHRSYEGARDLFEISVPAMDAMIEAMRKGPGCIGARQAGAGFGGCMVAFVVEEQVDAFSDVVARTYESATGITPEIYPTHTAAGAGRL